MQSILVTSLVQVLFALLDSKVAKVGLDAMLDAIEDAIERSDSRIDDVMIMPVIARIRVALKVPDND